MGILLHWIVLLQPVSSVLPYSYNSGYFADAQRPVDLITDVVNDLGVKILQQYSVRGNVAFSPTGVAFVLAALYEGSAGRGKQQIVNAVGLPADRDVIRIGFRDIHRRLRSYLNADGFLGGLTLSKENTRLRPEYEDILRFYGFDLSNIEQDANVTVSMEDVLGTTELPTTTVGTTSNGNIPDMTNATATTMASISSMTLSSNGTEIVIGPPIVVNTTQDTVTTPMDTATQSTLPSITSSIQPVAENTTIQPTNFSTTITTGESTQPPSSGAENVTVSTNMLNTEQASTSASTTITDVTASNQSTPATTASNVVGGTSGTMMNTSINGVTTDIPIPVVPTISDAANTTIQNPVTVMTVPQTVPGTNTTINPIAPTANVTNNSTIVTSTNASLDNQMVASLVNENTISTRRKKKSIENKVIQLGSSPLKNASEKYKLTEWLSSLRKRTTRSPRGYFSSYPDEGIWMQNLDIWKSYSASSSEASPRDSTAEITFLVNGCDVSSVSASRYIAVLPFAYFPSLHAIALEFPLDDPRYNIILLMPTDRTDTHRLARDLSGKSLRSLRKRLQPTWVRAAIPSFMLRGFVTLTSFLQKLGVLDVFEPRVADLSPMTADLGVYARDVQQSIGVNIRNYMKPDRTHSRESSNVEPSSIVPPRKDYYRYLSAGNGLFERAGPVPFTALHPFLYFIVDTETSVSLIAGRVDDPLNSRIL